MREHVHVHVCDENMIKLKNRKREGEERERFKPSRTGNRRRNYGQRHPPGRSGLLLFVLPERDIETESQRETERESEGMEK